MKKLTVSDLSKLESDFHFNLAMAMADCIDMKEAYKFALLTIERLREAEA